MSKIYAQIEGSEKRILVYIECDTCEARIKPHLTIAKSGWTIQGWDNGPGTDKHTVDYCPRCTNA